MKTKLLILSLTFMSLVGCKILYPPISFQPFCYSNKYNGIDTLINVNGYYRLMDTIDREVKPIPRRYELGFTFLQMGYL